MVLSCEHHSYFNKSVFSFQARPPFIPEGVLNKKKLVMDVDDEQKVIKKLERDLEMELGDDYILDLKKNYDLPDDFKYDVMPELWEGHNITDFVDPDVMKVQ